MLRFFATYKKVLSLDTANPRVVQAEYAVRGDVVLRASSIERELNAGKKHPFTQLTYCNIGNPQSLKQKPLSWVRQVLSLLVNPDLLSSPLGYPTDVVDRAKALLNSIDGAIGAYSHSQGIHRVRDSVASFIEDRDGYSGVSPDNIFLTDGASSAVNYYFSLVCHQQNNGVMLPIPQYPLYSALLTLNAATTVPYYMDSVDGRWVLNIETMQKSLDTAKAGGVTVHSLVVINPGNPTGQVLSYEDMQNLVSFCELNRLVLIADEVYQDNIYREHSSFFSFRKAILDMKSPIECISLHSVSKGFLGECGLRGGYLELHNIDASFRELIYKLASIGLCSNTIGQVALELMVNPPKRGEPSYALYTREKTEILAALKRKGQLIHNKLNQMKNIQCNYVDGAMYAFPNVKFTQKALQTAEGRGMPVDKLYIMEALDSTGIVLVPGSGFGQKPGTFHFRITVLAPEESLPGLLDAFSIFNGNFHSKYSDN